jgi:hypothetical protein
MSPPDDHDGVNRRSVLQGLSAGAIGAWISPLLAGSKTMPDTPADLILYNGRLHTVDRKKPQASAVAIKDGRFVVVGSDAQAMALQGPATQVVDLHGRTVIRCPAHAQGSS